MQVESLEGRGVRWNDISGIFNNNVLLCALISWVAAQVLKVPVYALVEKKINLKRILGSGGMPSSHTSFVVALCLMVGFTAGFDSVHFAVAFVLAAVVMYDAMGVRRETGTQAAVINQILRDVLIDGKPISDEALKELVGHTPLEVLAGTLIGVLTVVLYLL